MGVTKWWEYDSFLVDELSSSYTTKSIYMCFLLWSFSGYFTHMYSNNFNKLYTKKGPRKLKYAKKENWWIIFLKENII